MSSPFELLGLADTASQDEVRQAWRRLAALHHPDKGGDAAEFTKLSAAYRTALSMAADRLCQACNGSGTRKVQRGFHTINVPCETCGGSGKA